MKRAPSCRSRSRSRTPLRQAAQNSASRRWRSWSSSREIAAHENRAASGVAGHVQLRSVEHRHMLAGHLYAPALLIGVVTRRKE